MTKYAPIQKYLIPERSSISQFSPNSNDDIFPAIIQDYERFAFIPSNQ